jgi:hypothetical protein
MLMAVLPSPRHRRGTLRGTSRRTVLARFDRTTPLPGVRRQPLPKSVELDTNDSYRRGFRSGER